VPKKYYPLKKFRPKLSTETFFGGKEVREIKTIKLSSLDKLWLCSCNAKSTFFFLAKRKIEKIVKMNIFIFCEIG